MVVESGYVVDRIVYYSQDGIKKPDPFTWTDEDKQLELDKIIVLGAAANGTGTDFKNAFLVKCKDNTTDEQEKAFYCQYIDLLEYLGRKQMDYQLMGKFYKEMLDKEQYNSALSIRDMLNDLMKFRGGRIYNSFLNNHAPFEKSLTNSTLAQYEYIRNIAPDERIKIDIWSEQNQTKILFWIQDAKTKSDLIGTILQKIGEEDNFTKEGVNSYVKIFKFPEEDEMLDTYLKKLFALLDKNKDAITT
ncbi:MAG: hypothetical protein LBB82_01230 [Treponema sp.]|nr:hypothetical protein [Treponema sp.]